MQGGKPAAGVLSHARAYPKTGKSTRHGPPWRISARFVVCLGCRFQFEHGPKRAQVSLHARQGGRTSTGSRCRHSCCDTKARARHEGPLERRAEASAGRAEHPPTNRLGYLLRVASNLQDGNRKGHAFDFENAQPYSHVKRPRRHRAELAAYQDTNRSGAGGQCAGRPCEPGNLRIQPRHDNPESEP